MDGPDNAPQTNYLSKARDGKMPLVEGDYESFGNVLSLIDDYEGYFSFLPGRRCISNSV